MDMFAIIERDISCELWREYDIPGRESAYRITNPTKLFIRPGGSTHRVLDMEGVIHCVPAPGFNGCVLRWKSADSAKPVKF